MPIHKAEGNIVSVKVGEVDYPNVRSSLHSMDCPSNKSWQSKKVLKPEDAPVTQFALLPEGEVVALYEYCNLYGLYKA